MRLASSSKVEISLTVLVGSARGRALVYESSLTERNLHYADETSTYGMLASGGCVKYGSA